MVLKERLWTRRNERFHGQLDGKERQVDVVVKHLLLEYQVANKKELATISNEIKEKGSTMWVKLQLEQVKFNSDASWQKRNGQGRLRKGGLPSDVFPYGQEGVNFPREQAEELEQQICVFVSGT
ncbi:hypothetical protein CTI12_AA429360 [Artemisia annua]|uniref:Uncharacterized protein n=1 Tax=Artemisia annua TaxID=35608 RepID=A0A2U1M1U9_ARTAN|nr:hypothetical protein CTI12_AA429360 [Artemisia annua]